MFLSESTLVKIIKEEMVKAIREQEEESVESISVLSSDPSKAALVAHLTSAVRVWASNEQGGRAEFEFTVTPHAFEGSSGIENVVLKRVDFRDDVKSKISKMTKVPLNVPEGRYLVSIIIH